MSFKYLASLIVVSLFYTTAQAQCPTMTNYDTKNNQSNKCPGGAQGPSIDPDFTGGPYEAIPGSSKDGNLLFEWSTNQTITPAIQSYFTDTTISDDAGPAGTLTFNGSGYESKYCLYSSTFSMPNTANVTVFFVDPIEDTAMYSCSYSVVNTNPSTLAQPTITTQPTIQHACVGYPASFSVAATAANGGGLTYQWRKDGTNISGATSTTYSISSVSASDVGRYSCIVFESGEGIILSDEVPLTIDSGIVWAGSTDNDWATSTNWVGNSVPTSSDNIYIDGVTNNPQVTSGTVSCRCMTLGSSADITVDGGTLAISGTIKTNGGTITADNGSITLNGSTLVQTIPDTVFANDSIRNLTINNALGVTLDDTVNITGVLTPTSGTLTTNNMLRIISNSEGSGYVMSGSNGGGYIADSVIVERYIPGGTRAYRFFTHPFNSGIPLSQVIDDVDITGKGGVDSGFTYTKGKNNSAYWFNPATADTATSGSNSGWEAYTSTDDMWEQYQMMRLFVRGAKGEGLQGANYTPSATTIDLIGNINQGDQTITMTKGANSPYVIAGNPFPSSIQMNALTVGTDISSNFTVWDVNQGARGGYTSVPFATSYIMPPFGSFVVTVTSNTDNDIVIEEADKVNATPQSVFKTTASLGYNVQLRLHDSSTFWDRILLIYDNSAMSVEDKKDAVKLYNPGLDFYTMSTDQTRLSIDSRPYTDKDTLQLGLIAYNRYTEYTMEVPDFDVPNGVKLYFLDRYLNKLEEMKPGYEYTFDVTADSNSQGNDRFAIVSSGVPANSIQSIEIAESMVQLVPNPAFNGDVKISYKDIDGAGSVNLISVSGRVLQTVDIEGGTGSVVLSVENIPSGVYIVEVKGNNTRYTTKLVKQ